MNTSNTCGGMPMNTIIGSKAVLEPVKNNWWWSLWYMLVGFTPQFLGHELKRMRYYTEFYNPITNKRYLRDNLDGTILER